ncbi:MAG TPA: alpha-N-arabinofuranosidase [Opitutaceae bacterium]
MKRLTLYITLASACVVARAQTSAPHSVEANIDAEQVGQPISPYLYGQFVEHAGNAVYHTMWSELLDDRKFFYDVAVAKPDQTLKATPGSRMFDRSDGGPGRWNPVGPADSVSMDTENPFVGDHTPRVTLAGNDPRGICQDRVKLIANTVYQGRIQLAGDSGVKVKVNIIWGTAPDSPRQSIEIGTLSTKYKRFNFSFTAQHTGESRFEIVGLGHGAFHIGAVSLMPKDNIEGWKPGPIEVLRSLHSGVYRFPGGNFVSAHEWRNGIGDPDHRPPIHDPVWNSVNSNDVGTDEFLTMCRLLEVEPYITVNAGSGDEFSAAQWVEYTNGSAETLMGKQRAANGHPAPYHVKFWGVGNEMWGDYQYGYMPLKQFLWKQNEFAKAMRKVDSSIVLIASGAMPDTMTGAKQSLILGKDIVPDYLSPADWTGALLVNCFDYMDLISEHFYNFGATHFSLAKNQQIPNDANEPVTDWMRRGANHVRIKVEEYREYEKRLPQLKVHPKPINLDEWAYIGGKYEVYPAYAWIFHELFRNTDIYKMAAQTFGFSLIRRDKDKPELTANGLVFKIYRDHFGTLPVSVTGNSPQPKPTEPFGGEQPATNAGSPTFPLDVVAAWTAERKILTVAVLNPTESEQSIQLNIQHANLLGSAVWWRLASTETDAKNPTITNATLATLPATVTVPRFSITIYQMAAK